VPTPTEREVWIDRLRPDDAGPLARFFAELAADTEATGFFHPHPLTRRHAAWLCGPDGPRRDRYFLARQDGKPVGYSMLRGWDEGYEVPSFGACVLAAARGQGLGHLLLSHAIDHARWAGAPRLRLTVYRANERAVRLYTKFGFAFTDKNPRELVGLLDLQRRAA
jgi:ribosomal protein S18 acetylase RimI-like enzyme